LTHKLITILSFKGVHRGLPQTRVGEWGRVRSSICRLLTLKEVWDETKRTEIGRFRGRRGVSIRRLSIPLVARVWEPPSGKISISHHSGGRAMEAVPLLVSSILATCRCPCITLTIVLTLVAYWNPPEMFKTPGLRHRF
jgi:hypothetical protein